VITDVPGIRVGHWTDEDAHTGCTVVLAPPGAIASGEIRGGAPAERDFALLAPERTVPSVDAVVLSGGSVWGLSTADGAVRWLEERGAGLETPAGRVPIVVGLAIFDLLVAAPGVRPGAGAGYAACEAAQTGPVATGRIGAGAGASVGAWRGPDRKRPSGLGGASERQGDLVVGALAVVNALGEPIEPGAEHPPLEHQPAGPFQNTTLAVVATNARLDKVGCFLCAQSGHDGMARALEPAHTSADGDAVVALATGAVDAAPDVVRVLAARAVEAAIRQAAR
jgi:L-aminopeptidase/D-esterase-like protein